MTTITSISSVREQYQLITQDGPQSISGSQASALLTALFNPSLYNVEHKGGFFQERTVNFIQREALPKQEKLSVCLDKVARLFVKAHETQNLDYLTAVNIGAQIQTGYQQNTSVIGLFSSDRAKFEKVYQQIIQPGLLSTDKVQEVKTILKNTTNVSLTDNGVRAFIRGLNRILLDRKKQIAKSENMAQTVIRLLQKVSDEHAVKTQ